jgi:hypothetical protein
MVKVRDGIEFPIIPEDLIDPYDELTPELFEYLLFLCAMSRIVKDAEGVDPKFEFFNSSLPLQ